MEKVAQKIVFWMVASFSSVLFANNFLCPRSFSQSTPPTHICAEQNPCCPDWSTPLLNAAYNYPASIETHCPWDLHIDASYIYWQPFEENMEPFLISAIPTAITLFDGDIPKMPFDYKSGFKIGVGTNFGHDHWDLYAGYTWFHGKDRFSASVNPSEKAIIPLLGPPSLFATSISTFATGNVQWSLKMDFGDLDLGRRYYLGTHLLFRPAIGIRGAWIRQNRDATFVSAPASVPSGTALIHENWYSWGVGPRGSLNTQWQLGKGFSLYGIGAVDLLYTRYTSMKETGSIVSFSGDLLSNIGVNQKLDMLRTHLELELGFDWSTYLHCNKWYIDFSIGYVFHDFFHQRIFMSTVTPSGDLFIHGLTTKLSVYF